MNPVLKNNLTSVIGAGALAMAIATTMLKGDDGLEGRRYTPYNDVGGVLTVCDGHTGKDIIRGKKYSDSECDAFLAADLKKVADGIDPVITVPLPEPTRAALYSFAYNVGVGAFRDSTLLKKLNAGDVIGACDQLKRWIFAAGKPWQGLINRRDVEHMVCTWTVKPLPIKVENDIIKIVEAPIQDNSRDWFALTLGAALFGLFGSVGVMFWRLRKFTGSHDREPKNPHK